MDTKPDETLAEAAAGGDRDAFAALISRHYDRIFGLAWRLTGSAADAQDLAQDICATLPDRLARFRGESKLTTWLYRVVVNACADLRRRQMTRARAADGWGDWEIARQAEADEARDARLWLEDAMARLSPELRETLALVLGEGLTQAEAGVILGIGEGTVSWRISEAKKRMRRMAEEEGA